MKLLISVVDEAEALEALKGGADIVDVKNPNEGSLGANFPWIIRQVKGIVQRGVEVSATLGDLPNIPGTAALAALGAASSGADYVKVGLFGTRTQDEAVFMMRNVCRAVKNLRPTVKVIASGYADFEEVGSLNPMRLPKVAQRSGAHGVLVDIKTKGDEKLFDYLASDQLRDLARRSHGFGLTIALAGSLDREDVAKARELGADIVGIRRAACERGDRLHGRVRRDLVREIAEAVRTTRE